MQFDDRLATVLRMQAGTERAAHTQFRQLLDLAGSARASDDEGLLEAAYERFGALSAALPPEDRAAMIREPGLRLRNPGFVAFLASQDLPVASAAVASARLSEMQWEALIPALPVPIRALLSQRSDLPDATHALLARLGMHGLGLPEPDQSAREMGEIAQPVAEAPAASTAEPAPQAPEPVSAIFDLDPGLELGATDESNGIGALVRRIEAYRRARAQAAPPPGAADAPRLPLGEQGDEPSRRALSMIDFATDAEGRISWAEAGIAPMVVGLALGRSQRDAAARADSATIAAMRRYQPVRGGRIELDGAPAIAGHWRIDAAPVFAAPGGRFTGYRGRMRRPLAGTSPVQPEAPAEPADSAADRMRQVIHELRTPVNAIQGFAEIIQQQLFGPTPNEYRALAASIVGDAARMLAGFEELDRLGKLESGSLELEPGYTDFNAIVVATAGQLDAALRPRNSGIDVLASGSECPVPFSRADAEMLAWRILATLAGATSPEETLQIVLARNGHKAGIEVDLPASLAAREDIFESTAPAPSQAMTAGMFGAGFTLRLARAEARAIGGELSRVDDLLVLTLPLASKPLSQNDNKHMDSEGEIADSG